MAYTRHSARQIFNTKMQHLLSKIQKDEQDKLEREANNERKRQENLGKLNAILTLGGMYKDVKEGHEMTLMQQEYVEGGVSLPKFTREDPRSIGEILTQPKESLKRLLPGTLGAYQETEGYKEFKLGEEEEALSRIEEATKKSELDAIDNAKFNQYDLTKARATELTGILEREGVVLPADMSEEDTLELLSTFDKVPKGKYPVGARVEDQPEYRAFIDDLKSKIQEDIPLDTVEDMPLEGDEGIVEDMPLEGDAGIDQESPIFAGEQEPYQYPAEQYGEDMADVGQDLPEGVLEGEEDITDIVGGRYAQAEEAKASLDVAESRSRYAQDPESEDFDPGRRTPPLPEEVSRRGVVEAAGAEGAPRGVEVLDEGIGFDDVSAEVADVGFDDVSVEVADMGFDDVSVETAAGIDAIPAVVGEASLSTAAGLDAIGKAPEKGLLGKAFQTGQNVMQLTNIGNTLTSGEATDEQKTVASTQGVKMLTELAMKKTGEKTAAEIGSKAFKDMLAKKTVEEGAKMGVKGVATTALGGVLGGYQMVTEAKEASESWEEGDYDEAILHGMGSAAGAAQTAGAGMMATGIGAPLGAVLYGVGLAGSLVSSAGLFLEGLFGGGGKKAAPEKPKFDAGRYLESLMGAKRRRRGRY